MRISGVRSLAPVPAREPLEGPVLHLRVRGLLEGLVYICLCWGLRERLVLQLPVLGAARGLVLRVPAGPVEGLGS